MDCVIGANGAANSIQDCTHFTFSGESFASDHQVLHINIDEKLMFGTMMNPHMSCTAKRSEAPKHQTDGKFHGKFE